MSVVARVVWGDTQDMNPFSENTERCKCDQNYMIICKKASAFYHAWEVKDIYSFTVFNIFFVL